MKRLLLIIILLVFVTIPIVAQNENILAGKIDRLKMKLLLTDEQFNNLKSISAQKDFQSKISQNKTEAITEFISRIEKILTNKQRDKFSIIKSDLKEELQKELK